MARTGGILNWVRGEVENRTNQTVVERDKLDVLEAVAEDYRAVRKDLDLLAWNTRNAFAGSQDVKPETRMKLVKDARDIWEKDPNIGAATEVRADFTFGRGVPRPKAKDPEVQTKLDEAWDDPDNQDTLTSYQAQVALSIDLDLQCNCFLVMFDNGDDGKVKLGLLPHDTVIGYVPDPENGRRPLYYMVEEQPIPEWDYASDRPQDMVTSNGTVRVGLKGPPTVREGQTPYQDRKIKYYEHWRNVQQAEEEGRQVQKPPANKMGEGRVYHIATNRRSEQVFGVPVMRRLARWASAYNDFLAARVDMAQAAAAFMMKRKVKGSPNQVAKMAAKMMSRRSELAGGTGTGYDYPQLPPRPGAVLTENEQVSHEPFKFDVGSQGAAVDAQMIRSAISAVTRLPQTYLGDQTSTNLATATAMELPVLKAIEARQELFEQALRWFLDRVVERAVEVGELDKNAPGATSPATFGPADLQLQNALQEAPDPQDEQQTERDLSYELSMPSPLRRMMTDLVTSIANIARTFDPNGSNLELSRVLLAIALGEGLEVNDPAGAVEDIFPPGYKDPVVAAAEAQGAQTGRGTPFGPQNFNDPSQDGGWAGADGQQHTADNPYGAPMQSGQPEDVMQQAAYDVKLRDRNGEVIMEARTPHEGRRLARDTPETYSQRAGIVRDDVETLFDDTVGRATMDALTTLAAEDAPTP